MWIVYDILLGLSLLCYVPKALLRKRLPHRGWFMRLGRYPEAVRGRLGQERAVWVHAVSVGEVMAVRPLIQQLQREAPNRPLVLSTVTPAGFQVASQWLGDRGLVIYAPLDLSCSVRRAIDLIRPSLLLLVESELWPGLIRLVTHRDVPVVVVNGRISERAYRRYRLIKPLLTGMLRSLDLCLMQTESDATRLIELGARPSRVKVLGSLKWDASAMNRPKPEEVAALGATLGLVGQERPLVVAGSTHRGEDEMLLTAFRGIRGHLDNARLIIAPRHLERVGDVEELLHRHGLQGGRISRLLESRGPWDVAVVDAMGQLSNYYALATVVIVGGSLIPHGGQNPIEPASLGKPILFGPWMRNFSEIVQQLLAHHAAKQLTSPDELTGALLELLTDRAKTEALGRRAREVTERSRGATQRTLEALSPLL